MSVMITWDPYIPPTANNYQVDLPEYVGSEKIMTIKGMAYE
jgi:hypothetical protein